MTESDHDRIAWAGRHMPVLRGIQEEWAELARRGLPPLAGLRVAACLHVTTETANLALALVAGGADVRLCASNPLSTQDDVVAALNAAGVATFARRGEPESSYYDNIRRALEGGPQIVMDDGADLIVTLHSDRSDLLPGIVAGTEETTTGVVRLKAMAADGALAFPVVAVNNAQTKHMFDNRYGTGQSTVDAIMRATNALIAGTTFVVAGYGWCGRGVAARAHGLGARVVVVEVDPLRALEAAMDGYWVMSMGEAARIGDIFVTVTGDTSVVRPEHFAMMKDGAILANSGHFNVEVDVAGLAAAAVSRRRVRENVEEFQMPCGRRLYVLAEGRLVNLAAAEGHPAAVMDMSFANQALVVAWLWGGRPRAAAALARAVHDVPAEIDRRVAALKLASMGITLDRLTDEQQVYLASWRAGTK
jgi:adenosylhomocysteinase